MGPDGGCELCVGFLSKPFSRPVSSPDRSSPHWVCDVAGDDVPVEVGLGVSEEFIVYPVWV